MATGTANLPRSVSTKMRRRRRRGSTLESEIRASAKQIYANGMSEAMKAAALLVVSRKLDEIRTLLSASGLGGAALGAGTPSPLFPTATPTPAAQPSPPQIQNPCVTCGRPGVYRSRPNQFNKSGSWYCRVHQKLGVSTDAEDRMETVAIQPPSQAVQPAAPMPAPQPAPGASSLSEAMGLAVLE